MSFRGVTVLKFVGTVSLGLLTGLSFSLSTVTVPTLLALPSARSAATAFHTLTDAATQPLRVLSSVASAAFLLAFALSPRSVRHPYLLYASLLVLGGRAATSDRLSPYLFSASAAVSGAYNSPPASPKHGSSPAGSSAPHMEASYEVLGAATGGSSAGSVSDAHSDGGAGSDGELAGSTATINGEEVRAAVEVFLKKQIVRTAVSGIAFAMAVVGIWGDGWNPVTSPWAR